jgi:hypothetical protein
VSDDILNRSDLLCACSNITIGEFYDLIAGNPKGFDEVLRDTNAGQKCTACLLDLEYHYVRAFEVRAQRPSAKAALKEEMPSGISLKRRIYNLIDAVSPLIPLKLRQVTPVIYGKGVKEWLVVSNDSLMYENEVVAPPFCLDIVLRDGEGRTVYESRKIVGAGERLRMDISDPLETADASPGELKLGWMDLMRRGMSPGIRGTTRPQIEIVSSAGICAVHTQAATERARGGLTVRLRPGEDRHFLTVVNAEPKPLTFRLSVATAGLAESIIMPVHVPPYGARLVEVPVPPVEPADRLGLLADVTWTTNRINKVYVLCATPSLDRFSVDHT